MKKQSLVGRLCLLGLGALLLPACTTLTTPDGATTPAPASGSAVLSPPSPGPSALRVPGLKWPEDPDFIVTRLNLGDAVAARPGTDYRKEYNTQDLAKDGRVLVPFALTEQGSLVGSTGKQEDYEHVLDALSATDSVGTYAGGKFTPFTTAGADTKARKPNFVAGGSATEAGTVWAELDEDSFMEGTWKIMGVPAGQKTARVLSTSKEASVPADSPMAFVMPVPIIANDRAYWHVAFPADTARGYEARVLSAPLEGGKDLRVERTQAYAPANFGSDVAVLGTEHTGSEFADNKSTSLIESSHGDVDLVRISASAPEGSSLESLGADGNIFSFTYLGDFYIANTTSGKVVAIPLPGTTHVANVAHCGDRATWSFVDQNSSPAESRYVYNALDASLRVLTDPAFTGTAQCGGDYLSWGVSGSIGGNPAVWDVVTRWEN